MIVDIFVVVTVKKIPEPFDIHGEIVAAGEGTEFAEKMWMTKGNVGGVKSTEGESMGNGALVIVLHRHKRQHFVENVFLVLHVPTNAVLGSHPFGVKAIVINAVDTVQLEFTVVDLVGQTMMNPKPLVLPIITIPCWKNEHLGSSMTNHEHAHFPTNPMTVPFVKLEVHSFP